MFSFVLWAIGSVPAQFGIALPIWNIFVSKCRAFGMQSRHLNQCLSHFKNNWQELCSNLSDVKNPLFCFLEKWGWQKPGGGNTLSYLASVPAATSFNIAANKERLCSLDAFRGLTISLMILVNCRGEAGAVFSSLEHAVWNGWSFADTVFPSFLFIVGVSLVFSFAGREENPTSNKTFELRVVRRTVILFVLGLLLNGFPSFQLSNIRIPGVLQRIAVCYLFASLIVLKCGLRGRILWLITLLVSYWVMMRFVPVPGVGTGVLEPGQNFAAWVDSLFLNGYMWSYYDGKWGPEGIVSTIPAIATTLFGVLTGQWLRSSTSEHRKAAGMLCSGLLLLIAGQILSTWLPINKSIWTSTFSIFMAGLALVCQALFYWFIDIAGFSSWTKPFIILGLNPIALYVLSQILGAMVPSMGLSGIFSIPIVKLGAESLLYPITILMCIYLTSWIMWQKRIFIRV
jgi:predicted acyltransferase